MSIGEICERHGFRDSRHGVTMLVTAVLVLVGLVLTVIELVGSTDDTFEIIRLSLSCGFFILAIVLSAIGFKGSGIKEFRILIVLRIAGVILNIVACALAAKIFIPIWVYIYLIVILVGLVAFFATLEKPKIAKPIILILFVVGLVYSVARTVVMGQMIVEAFRPALFEYILIAIYWSLIVRGRVGNR